MILCRQTTEAVISNEDKLIIITLIIENLGMPEDMDKKINHDINLIDNELYKI